MEKEAQKGKGVWDMYKRSRTIIIELGDISDILKGYYVRAMPTSAYEPTVSLAMEGLDDNKEQSREAMNLWIEEWNLVDNDGNLLPIPRDDPPVYEDFKEKDKEGNTIKVKKQTGGCRWESIIPFEVQTYIMKRIAEVDKERLEVPT